ncbi:MAG: hypothetical protein IPK50_04105 [Fibrobacterota bacterium]|nr:MAG: hypothetical protein IPK50_04105 [Fibrobacterota bacterium]
MSPAFRRWMIGSLSVILLAGCVRVIDPLGSDGPGIATTTRILVLDSAGNPAPYVEVVGRSAVWLDGEPVDSTGANPDGFRLRTGPDGMCIVPNVANSSQVVRAGGKAQAAALWLGSDRDSFATLRIARTGSVQGVVPHFPAGLMVRAVGLEGVARTDEEGRFSLGSLPEGPGWLYLGAIPYKGGLLVNFVVHSGRVANLGILPFLPADSGLRQKVGIEDLPLSSDPLVWSMGTFGR